MGIGPLIAFRHGRGSLFASSYVAFNLYHTLFSILREKERLLSGREKEGARLIESANHDKNQPVIPLSFHKYKEVACPICNFMQDLG